jgi:arylamine N-acetyltransferase
LEAQIRDTWEPLYLFTTQPQPLIDLQVGSWFASTHPTSYFVVGLTAALVTDDARWNLRGRNLAIHRGDETQRIRFDTAAEVVDALAERFGINLAGLGDVEARVAEVLDS